MDLTTFSNHLDRHGHRLEDWPEGLRAEARKLLAESVDARATFADAAALARALTALPDRPAPRALRETILAEVRAEAAGANSTAQSAAPKGTAAKKTAPDEAESWQNFLDWITGRLWRPALAATATVAFGFALGLSLPAADLDDEQLAAELGFLTLSAGYEELRDEN